VIGERLTPPFLSSRKPISVGMTTIPVVHKRPFTRPYLSELLLIGTEKHKHVGHRCLAFISITSRMSLFILKQNDTF
jgi:hypothetical protein